MTESLEENSNIKSLSDLPVEILQLIITLTYCNNVTTSFSKHIEWFSRLLLVNKQFYALGIEHSVNYCRFTRPQSFQLFKDGYKNNSKVYKYINVLDFQEFTSIGLGRTNRMNHEIQMVTSCTILQFLQKAKNLKEFLSTENIQDDISEHILGELFYRLPKLESIDFCGSNGVQFSQSFKSFDFHGINYNLKNLSMHDCIDIPNEVFVKLLPMLPNLEKLDLYHTKVNGDALMRLKETCRLTHLSLGCCYQINKKFLFELFIKKKEIFQNLKWLNLETDNINELSELEVLLILKSFIVQVDLPNLKLQYLNLNGRNITNKILKFIKKKFLFLKSLHIQNANIDVNEIVEFLSPPEVVKLHDQQIVRHSSTTLHQLTNSRISTMLRLNDYFNTDYIPSTQIPQINFNRERPVFQLPMEDSSNELTTPFQQSNGTNNNNNGTNNSNNGIDEGNNIDDNEEDIINNTQKLIKDSQIYQQLRFINVKGIKCLNTLNVLNNQKVIECCPSLLAWEFDSKFLEKSPKKIYTYPRHYYETTEMENFFWKVFDNDGRRTWLYKLRTYNDENSKYLNYKFNFDKDYHPKNARDNNDENSLVNNINVNDLDYEILTHDPFYIPNVTVYDIKTGSKTLPKVIFYPFLKYASKKIDISNGPFYKGDNDFYKIWPVKFSERGIYKYYSLNI